MYSISSIGKEKKPEWMDTGYLKMKDIEALPLDQRLEVFFFPEGSRTALAFLKKKEEMKVYTEHGDEIMRMTGNEIYHGYFDQANANIRTAMEYKSDAREMVQGSMERSGQPEIKGAAGQDQRKDEKNIPAKSERTEEKTRIAKQIKQPVKGR